MSIKSQQTQIYFLKAMSPTEVAKLGKVASFDGLGGSASEIDSSHFESVRREFLRGLRDGGTVSLAFHLDPTDTTQEDFFDLDDDGDPTWFCIALSDGTAAPTYSAGTPGLTAPAARTSFIFQAFVQQAQVSGQTDALIEVAAQLRVTGDIYRTFKP